MTLPKVIGIAGPARSGKDTTADYLLTRLPGYRKASFADPIKEMLRTLSLTEEQLYGDEKDMPHPVCGVTPRHMLQTLGTEWGRQLIHPGIWVMAMKSRIGDGVIIPDVRFENEAEFIRKHGVLIHMEGYGGIASCHVSEAGVKKSQQDRYLVNPGDSRLYSHIDALLNRLMEAKQVSNHKLTTEETKMGGEELLALAKKWKEFEDLEGLVVLACSAEQAKRDETRKRVLKKLAKDLHTLADLIG